MKEGKYRKFGVAKDGEGIVSECRSSREMRVSRGVKVRRGEVVNGEIGEG